MKRVQQGFTLIELMIVVAIIGILAAVALPAYQDYIARAQMSEPVELLAGGKTPMAEFYADKGVWPTDTASVMGNTAGKYTTSVEITAHTDAAPGALTMTATTQSTGVNSNIASKTVTLSTSDGGKIWRCASAGTAPVDAKYLPAACK